MKLSILIIVFLLSLSAAGQKVSKYNYLNVDTVKQYQNAVIVIYKDRLGKQKSDTIHYLKGKRVDLNIEEAEVVELYQDEKLKYKEATEKKPK